MRVFVRYDGGGNRETQVEAESEQWTAVGFSPDGEMFGSDAVIYRPEDEEVSEQFLDAKVLLYCSAADLRRLMWCRGQIMRRDSRVCFFFGRDFSRSFA